MLTDEEKRAAKAAKWYGVNGWGNPGDAADL